MSGFRSLLSSFQDATGTNTNTSSTSSNSTSSKESRATIGNPLNAKAALKKDIESLWRTSQIQTSIKTSTSNNNKNGTKNSNNQHSSTDTQDEKDKTPIHVAICATIVSTLPHEEIWKSWSSYHPKNKSTTASIHVHAKTKNAIRNNTWLRSKLIPISHNPNWNDYRIILAMLSLAQYAIKQEPKTTHFMMVTESCIPVGTLDELTNIIHEKGEHCSFLDAYDIHSPRCTRWDEHNCFAIDSIPKDVIHKALPGWALFSRPHMEEILNLKNRLNGGELYPLFKSVWAPEEVYFSTALALLGKVKGSNEVVMRSLMWSKWDANAKGNDRSHPIVYDGRFCEKLIDDIKADGCIFMRKWKRGLSIREWERIVLNRHGDDSKEVSKRVREDGDSVSVQTKRQKSVGDHINHVARGYTLFN